MLLLVTVKEREAKLKGGVVPELDRGLKERQKGGGKKERNRKEETDKQK
jgi:hypothetical protein